MTVRGHEGEGLRRTRQGIGKRESAVAARDIGDDDVAGGPVSCREGVPDRRDMLAAAFRQIGLRHPARGHDHDIGIETGDVIAFDKCAGAHVDAGMVDLASEPVDDADHVAPPSGRRGKQDLTSGPRGGFEERDGMAAKGQNPGGLKTGRAAAHHHGPPGHAGPRDPGIEPGLAARGDVVLTQGVPAAVDPVEAVSRTDAGANARRLAARQLVDDVRIRHVRACHAGHVDMAFRNGPVGCRRIGEPCSLQRHETAGLAHPARQLDVGGNRPGHAGHGFRQAHVGPAIGSVDVENVGNTVAADHAGDRDPFLGRQPVLVALVGTEPDADENVVARRRAAGLENLEEEARPVNKVAAIGVLAVVGERRQELARQMG